jgi:hypothetical protein
MAVNCGIYKMIMLKLCVFLGARPFAVYGISQRRPIVTFCIEFVTVGLWRMSFIVVVYCFLCVVCKAKIGLSITLLNVQLFTRKCVPQWVVINGWVRFNIFTDRVRSSATEFCFTGNRFRKFCSTDPSPWKTSLLLECLFLRDNSFSLEYGNEEDGVDSIKEIISFLCVS